MNKALVAAAQSTAGRRHPGRHHAMGWLVHLGAIGLFGVSILDACPLPLPIPGATDLLLLILIVHGQSPWLMVPLAVAGATLGALTTWSVGKKGGERALRRYVPERYYDHVTGWVKRRGMLAVALAAMLPPPIPLMPFLMAAGALGVPRSLFLGAFAGGRTVRYVLISLLGITYGRNMIHWWNHYLADYSALIGWSILAVFAAASLWALWKWRRNVALRHAQPVHS